MSFDVDVKRSEVDRHWNNILFYYKGLGSVIVNVRYIKAIAWITRNLCSVISLFEKDVTILAS